MDRLELRGLRVMGICGALPEERERTQPLEIDLDLELDLAPAGSSDDLSDTLDYGAVASAVERVVAEGSPVLLEALAERIAAAAASDPRVRSVTVAVRKLRPPVPVALDTAGVRITRSHSPAGAPTPASSPKRGPQPRRRRPSS